MKYIVKYKDTPIGIYNKSKKSGVHYNTIGKNIEMLERKKVILDSTFTHNYAGKVFANLENKIRDNADIFMEKCADNYFCYDVFYLRKDVFDEYLKDRKYKKIEQRMVNLLWKLADIIKRELSNSRFYLEARNYFDEWPSDIVMNLFSGKNYYFGFYDLFSLIAKWDEYIEIPDFYEDGDSEYLYSYDSKATHFRDCYNAVIYRLKEYHNRVVELGDLSNDKIILNEKNKCLRLFKKMLTEIDETYDDKWTFEKWIEVMKKRYVYLERKFDAIYNNLLDDGRKDLAMKINGVEEVYCELEETYEKDAKFYKKYKLTGDKTYSDIYDEREKALGELFKKMLDFIGVKPTDDDFRSLKLEIREHFPYYNDTITHLDVTPYYAKNTMKDLIEYLDGTYDYFEKTYKEHEENLRKYEEEMEMARKCKWDLDEIEIGEEIEEELDDEEEVGEEFLFDDTNSSFG